MDVSETNVQQRKILNCGQLKKNNGLFLNTHPWIKHRKILESKKNSSNTNIGGKPLITGKK
jgi:hypothetical protein